MATLVIEGKVRLDQKEACSDELPLRAFAFDDRGRALGDADVSAEGAFAIATDLKAPRDVEVLVGPRVEAAIVREAQPPLLRFTARDWVKHEGGFRLSPAFDIPKLVWWPWWPMRVCVRGRVRKTQPVGGPCPVPFVTVEVFDVDREACLWPILRPRLPYLFDRPVIKLPELVRQPPIPDPIGPVSGVIGDRLQQVALNPQPLPPGPDAFRLRPELNEVALNPQPIPPGFVGEFDPQPEPPAFGVARPGTIRVGEMAQLPESIASRLQNLTVTSRVEPWLLWPRCFYSKAKVCETTTDCDGRFTCCFLWWPFHVRNGRLRFDRRPDIVIKVTQTIGAVSRVIYLDPYTSTRWDSWGAYIDLVLDDDDVVCGSGCAPEPDGPSTFFVRVGNDEVYQINQATGAFDLTRPGLTGTIDNMAYGGGLNIHAVFGDALAAAAPQFYYRLSIMGPTTGGQWKDVKTKLADTRVHKVTHVSDTHDLGPFTVGGVNNLYEVRDTATYDWYNRDWIGHWATSSATDLDTYVEDEGLYTVRLEVFNAAGVKQTSATVDYRDGTVIPPAVLPAMVDACYLVMLVDNKPATVGLAFPAVVNSCGVVPITSTPFNITANVNQENGRLHSWTLSYVKGLGIASGTLDSDSSDTGLAVPVAQAVSSAPMTAGLTGTCAFSLTISAWAHIRNGYGLIYHSSRSYALAVDACKCP